jgi:TPR repeat protein
MKRSTLLAGAAAVIVGAIAGYLYWNSKSGPSNTPPQGGQPASAVANDPSAIHAAAHSGPTPTAGRTSSEALESFLTTKARAEAGEAVAQRELAEMYGRCMPVNIDPQKFLASIDAMAAVSKSPANAEGMKRVGRATAVECAAVDNGAIIPLEARNLWLDHAAKQGDLAAQAQLFMGTGKRPQGDDLRKFMDQVVASGDPAALFEMGQLVSGNSTGEGAGKYSSVAGDTLSGYAWSIAACQRGLNCNAGSSIMNSVCLNTSGCSSPDFESFVREYLVSAGDAALLNSKVQEVSSLLPNPTR